MVKLAVEIADLIDKLRQRLDLTQEQFTARPRVMYPTINRWGEPAC